MCLDPSETSMNVGEFLEDVKRLKTTLVFERQVRLKNIAHKHGVDEEFVERHLEEIDEDNNQ